MEFKRKLPSPQTVREMYPVSDAMAERKLKTDDEIKAILSGKDKRFLLLIGPCSADREDAVLEYMRRLRTVQDRVREKILIVPRVYSNKPRTTGEGYKGMLHQPNPGASPDLLKGLIATRKLHICVLEETGFSSCDEMLYPENHYYLSDLLSYVAVGARSVEDQQHRLTASGLDIAVGMKNPTGGDLSVMMHSILAAQHPHTFVYTQWEVHTNGNPYAHAILRGSVDRYGRTTPNYHYDDLSRLYELYMSEGAKNPAVIVDTNHSNSGKQWAEQPRIAKEVLSGAAHSTELRSFVKGLMIESYLIDGNQPPAGTNYGQSITDGCIGWEKTERLICEIAEMRK